jgi:hypothetical protein
MDIGRGPFCYLQYVQGLVVGAEEGRHRPLSRSLEKGVHGSRDDRVSLAFRLIRGRLEILLSDESMDDPALATSKERKARTAEYLVSSSRAAWTSPAILAAPLWALHNERVFEESLVAIHQEL